MQVQNNARILQRNFFKTNLKQLLLSKLNLSFLVALLLVCLTASSAFATTYTFTNAVDNNWDTAANWSPSYQDTTIAAGDTVNIPATCQIVSISIINNGTLNINEILSIKTGGTLQNNSTLNISSGKVQITDNCTLSNSGILNETNKS
jgi:hypothetical protein